MVWHLWPTQLVVPPCCSVLQPATEVWLVSEFCNRGPLLTAIERGAFLTQPSSQYGQPNLISVLQVSGVSLRLQVVSQCWSGYQKPVSRCDALAAIFLFVTLASCAALPPAKQTLQEIAAALQYLHRNDVLHGDLTGGAPGGRVVVEAGGWHFQLQALTAERLALAP